MEAARRRKKAAGWEAERLRRLYKRWLKNNYRAEPRRWFRARDNIDRSISRQLVHRNRRRRREELIESRSEERHTDRQREREKGRGRNGARAGNEGRGRQADGFSMRVLTFRREVAGRSAKWTLENGGEMTSVSG